jgi:hypothetical protein
MKNDKWSRRKLLAGMAAGATLLPFVPLLEGDARGQTTAFPKRLLVWFVPNGTLPSAFFPTTTGTGFEMTRILDPLTPYKDRLLVLKGIRLNAYDAGVKIVHISCMAPLLTGYTIPTGAFDEAGTKYGWAAGPSVDQVIASAIGSQTKFPSLEFHNVGAVDQLKTQYRVIYKGADQPVTGVRDPRAAYKRIFEGFMPPGGGGSDGGAPPAQSQLNRGRLSILDHSAARLNKLRQTVGAADRAKIDAHLAAVASLQQRFSVPTTPPPPPPTGGGCAPREPALSINVPTGDCGVNDNAAKACELDKYYADLGKAHMDILVQALACDLTRVASLQWGAAGRGSYFSVMGADALPGGGENEHLISHLGTSDPKMEATNGIYVLLKRWYMKQLAYLIERLKAIPEGTGTLFDNTLILVCSEHGVGASHSPDNIPFVLIGGNWYFKTGRYLTFQNVSNNNLLLSVCHAMGQTQMTTFGDPKYCTGPLTGLT